MNSVDESIQFLSGFYADEGTHIWTGKRAYLYIRGQKFKMLKIVAAKGSKESDIKIINCERQEDMKFDLVQRADDNIEIYVNLFADSMLLCVESSEVFQPNIETVGSNDYRMLGICMFELNIVSDERINELINGIKIEMRQTLFLLENYSKGYIHDPDYKFLENFKGIQIPGYFLDIGANIGQSATSIANAHPTVKILSYEPNALLKNNLEVVRLLLNGRMDYNLFGVGETKESRIFYVPHIKDEYFSQEGSFERTEVESKECHNRILQNARGGGYGANDIQISEYEFATTDLNDKFYECYFIKIDTQGYEKSVVIGINNLIKTYRPVLILERGFDENEIMQLLDGYEIVSYDARKNKFVKYNTNTSNVFCVSAALTKNDKINEILRELLVGM